MANKYDAATLAATAQHLEDLAKSTRSNMLSRTTDKATGLGSEGERLRRQAKAADDQGAAADKLAATQLQEAATYDARAVAGATTRTCPQSCAASLHPGRPRRSRRRRRGRDPG